MKYKGRKVKSQQKTRQGTIKFERRVKLFLVFLILTSFTATLLIVPYMLVSFLVAFVITYLFKPTVNYLERAGLNRSVSVLLPYLVMGIVFVGLGFYLGPILAKQISGLETELPKYILSFKELSDSKLTDISDRFSFLGQVDLAGKAVEISKGQAAKFVSNIPTFLSGFFTVIAVAPFIAFFMLRDGRRVSHQLLSIVPNNLFEVAMNLHHQINRQLGSFIRARLLESVIIGGVVWLGLLAIGFPYSLVLGIVAGSTNLIPYLGPIIGAIPGVIMALVIPDSSVALVVSIYLLAQIIDNFVVIPFVVAKIVDLHPATVIIVVIVGSYLMGILGMIISVPVASIIKLTFTEFFNSVVDFRQEIE